MALPSLRRFDVQARYAVILSFISVVPFLGAAGLVWRNYDRELGQIVYGAQGRFLPTFVGCVLLSMLPGALGFLFGWSSAGQRRNDKPARSWVGFFLGGTVLTLDIIMLIAFYLLRLKHLG